MLEGPLVFVDVDTQGDFLDPGGALFIEGSAAIRPNLARLTRFARERDIPVLATACAHGDDDEEFATFPPHCRVGTPGQERIAETRWPGSRVLDPGGPIPESPVPHLTIPKQQYDAFSHPDLARVLDVYGRGRPIFVVYGVATDYCVACAVGGLLSHGHRVAVVVDAVRAVEPESEAEHLKSFADRGALLTVADAVCGD